MPYGFQIQDSHIETRSHGGSHINDTFVAALSQVGTRVHFKRAIEGAKTYDIMKSD